MKLRERLKESEFKQVFDKSRKYFGRYVVIFVSDSISDRVGFVASKKIGGAIERNRAKRLMREAFLMTEPFLPYDRSFIIVARREIVGKKMQDVFNELKFLLKQDGIKL